MAVVELLRRLAADGADGAKCRYHGDFDWAGLRMAHFLSTRVEWLSWRFAAVDHLSGVRDGKPSLCLSSRQAESVWDPMLAVATAECGLDLEDEAVAEILVADLLAGWGS